MSRTTALALLLVLVAVCCAVAGWYDHARTAAVLAGILAVWQAVYRGMLVAGERIDDVNEPDRHRRPGPGHLYRPGPDQRRR